MSGKRDFAVGVRNKWPALGEWFSSRRNVSGSTDSEITRQAQPIR
jgi:hypothetical protein